LRRAAKGFCLLDNPTINIRQRRFRRELQIPMKTTRLLLTAVLVLLGEVEGLSQTILWSGNGDGTLWSNPNNWVGQQVPGPANNVIITNGAGSNVVISSDVSVESIQCSFALTVSGGSLIVTSGPSWVQGAFSVYTSLSASGRDTTLVSTGPVDIDNASLYVSGGAVVVLPGVVDYDLSAEAAVLQASGAGSVLALPGLTNLVDTYGYLPWLGDWPPIVIEAAEGGLVNLGAAISFSSGNVQVQSDGDNSMVDLSALTVFYGCNGSELLATNGGTILAGQLRVLNDVVVPLDVSGTLVLSAVTNIDSCSFYLSGGATLSLPEVLNYSNNSAYNSPVFQASGAGSVLALTSLTNVINTIQSFGSYFPMAIQALDGGRVNMGGLVSIDSGLVGVLADATNSEVDLSALTSFYGLGGSGLQATDGGAISLGHLGVLNGVTLSEDAVSTLNLTTVTNLIGSSVTVSSTMNLSALTDLSGSSVYVTNGVLILNNVVDIDNASLYVSNAATLSLPAVVSCDDSGVYYSPAWQASGMGSVLAMTGLTNATGQYDGLGSMLIAALEGGRVNLSGATSFSSAPVDVYSDGSNSVVDLSALTSLEGNDGDLLGFSELDAIEGGTILLGPLGSLNGVTLVSDGTGTLNLSTVTNMIGSRVLLSGGTLTLSNVANIDNAQFFMWSGATLSLPEVSDYLSGSVFGGYWGVSGAGSTISLPGLTNLTSDAPVNYPMQIQASDGGQVLLSNLQGIANGYVSVLSDGTGSTVDLSDLKAFVLQNGQGSLTAQNGGTILLNNQVLLLANVAIDIPAGNPLLPPTVAPSSTLTLYGTAWHSYKVEEINTLQLGSPLTVLLVPLTNSFQGVASAPPPDTAFLVTDFVANPPILQMGLTPDNQVQLMIYGETNAAYQILSATNLDAPISWTPTSVMAMTNAFRIFPEIPPAAVMQFLRAEKQ
jgi:hypothetical protein